MREDKILTIKDDFVIKHNKILNMINNLDKDINHQLEDYHESHPNDIVFELWHKGEVLDYTFDREKAQNHKQTSGKECVIEIPLSYLTVEDLKVLLLGS